MEKTAEIAGQTVVIKPSHQVDHTNIQDSLNRLGYSNAQTVPATEKPAPLEEALQFGEDAAHFLGASAQEAVGGVTSHSRETASRNPLGILKEKVARLVKPRSVQPIARKAV